MRFPSTILYLLTFYMIFIEGDSLSILEMLQSIFFPQINTTGNGSEPLNIIVVKRDVASTIYKRSMKGNNIRFLINGKNRSLLPPCQDDQLIMYLAEIQAINPEAIINLATLDDIPIICRQVADSLDQMDAYLKECQVISDKNLYVQLIKGVDKLYDILCEDDSKLKCQIEAAFPCLKQLHDDFETCFGPPDWAEDINRRRICKSYKDIADCYYLKALQVCGKKSANTMKNVVKSVVDAILSIHCSGILMNPEMMELYDSSTHRNQVNIISVSLSAVCIAYIFMYNKLIR